MDRGNHLFHPIEKTHEIGAANNLKLYEYDQNVAGHAVENFVGKDPRVLIPDIPPPKLFIPYQEFLYGNEQWHPGFAWSGRAC